MLILKVSSPKHKKLEFLRNSLFKGQTMAQFFKSPKSQQLKWCNVSLMAITPFMLASSIQMEALAGDDMLGISFFALTLIHASFGVVMFALVFWHLYLHFGNLSWLKRLGFSPTLTKWLAGFGITTLASGIFILAYMLSYFEHNLVGAIHGKIGFVFVALAILHLLKNKSWIKRKLFNHS